LTQYKESPYQTYVKSDVWKCKESPSGAYHWVENRTLSTDGSVFQCVHCGDERRLTNLTKRNR